MSGSSYNGEPEKNGSQRNSSLDKIGRQIEMSIIIASSTDQHHIYVYIHKYIYEIIKDEFIQYKTHTRCIDQMRIFIDDCISLDISCIARGN